jgi:hypothetical protein
MIAAPDEWIDWPAAPDGAVEAALCLPLSVVESVTLQTEKNSNSEDKMAFIVTTKNGVGEKVPLRGTVWAFDMDRATRHETREAAQAALDKAKKFMKAATYKSAQIEEVA